MNLAMTLGLSAVPGSGRQRLQVSVIMTRADVSHLKIQ